MIKLQVIGNLGRDCVQREVNGKNVINFSVAHTERYKNSSGVTQDKTIWVECSYWTEKTGIVPYLLKGKTVYVEGTPEADVFKKQDGEAVATLRLRVREIQLVGGKDTGGTTESVPKGVTAETRVSEPVQHEESADDLPF
ncbi:MAG: single-stranded DNA-binding protein [Chitinophagaceae bacterium]|nr:single-stranded DNA-binding protein [Chitinophagaceae bacterium]